MIGAELGGGLVPAGEARFSSIESKIQPITAAATSTMVKMNASAAPPDDSLIGEIQEAAQRRRSVQDEPAFLLLGVER